MKTLYVVRHAKSSWQLENIADIDRPLNQRGINDAYSIGAFLHRQGHSPELIITSPAVRAVSTALMISRELKMSAKKIVFNDNIYEASGKDLIKEINAFDNGLNSVMIFGHEPTFTTLINTLSKKNISAFPTCTVACLEFNVNSWQEIINKSGNLNFLLTPKEIPVLNKG